MTEQYRSGQKSFDSVVRAKDRLIDAELELASDHQQRLALLRQQVKMFESLSAATDKRFELGLVRQPERLSVRVAFLDAKTMRSLNAASIVCTLFSGQYQVITGLVAAFSISINREAICLDQSNYSLHTSLELSESHWP